MDQLELPRGAFLSVHSIRVRAVARVEGTSGQAFLSVHLPQDPGHFLCVKRPTPIFIGLAVAYTVVVLGSRKGTLGGEGGASTSRNCATTISKTACSTVLRNRIVSGRPA